MAELALAWHQQMMFAGHWQVWEECLLEVIAALTPQIPIQQVHALNHCLAVIYFRTHRLKDSLALLHINEELAHTAGDQALLTATYTAMSETYLNALSAEEAEYYAREATRLAHDLGDPIMEADGLIDTARALVDAGRLDAAEACLRQALGITRTENNAKYTAKTLIFLGHVFRSRNALTTALTYYRAALALVESYGDQSGIGVVLSSIGRVLMTMGQYDEAEKALTRSLHLLQERGNGPASQIVREQLVELRRWRVECLAPEDQKE